MFKFGPDVVQMYKSANQAYNPAAHVKSASDAENVLALFALELKFMVGCDCKWTLQVVILMAEQKLRD